jgi:hypothetical protein
MPVPIAITARLERTLSNSSPPGKLAKQCGHATCREHKAYLGLRPFLIGEISGDVGAETCQHRSEKKIDAVESMKARIGSWNICRPE